jgi:methylthioribulose-1-phosphate dehydratase
MAGSEGLAASSTSEIADRLAALVRAAHARGWTLGTSGNFSAVLESEPLRLLITPSGADKGEVQGPDLVTIDGEGRPMAPAEGTTGRGGRPSAETPLHLAIVRACGAGAVSHTHSVWSTMLSDAGAPAGGLAIEGYEMLKGLSGITTHEHREWLPVIENTQDWVAEAPRVESRLRESPGVHGLLIRRHGLYTWGRDLGELKRHLEILEFLLEVVGRTRAGEGPVAAPP